MAKLNFCAFAERVSVDSFSNTLDLINVAEQLMIPELPQEVFVKARREKKPVAIPVRLMFVAIWKRSEFDKSEGVYKARVELKGPSKKSLSTLFQDVSLRDHTSVRSVINYQVLPFDGGGDYVAHVCLRVAGKWKKAGEAALHVNIVKSQLASASKATPRLN